MFWLGRSSGCFPSYREAIMTWPLFVTGQLDGTGREPSNALISFSHIALGKIHTDISKNRTGQRGQKDKLLKLLRVAFFLPVTFGDSVAGNTFFNKYHASTIINIDFFKTSNFSDIPYSMHNSSIVYITWAKLLHWITCPFMDYLYTLYSSLFWLNPSLEIFIIGTVKPNMISSLNEIRQNP